MKMHLQKVRPNAPGGFNTSTLCDRFSQASEDGFNSTDDPTKVTCKHCLRFMARDAAIANIAGRYAGRAP